MAVDTATKRHSAIGTLLPSLRLPPLPDGTVDYTDRLTLTGRYSLIPQLALPFVALNLTVFTPRVTSGLAGAVTSGELPEILNLLAGTYHLDGPEAANVWAGTSRLDLPLALNHKAGTTNLDLNLVCNTLAGTTNLDAAAALRTLL